MTVFEKLFEASFVNFVNRQFCQFFCLLLKKDRGIFGGIENDSYLCGK